MCPKLDIVSEVTHLYGIHQEIVFQIGKEAKKILSTGRPRTLYENLVKKEGRNLRKQRYEKIRVNKEITKETFTKRQLKF